jgi:hypothetical protein
MAWTRDNHTGGCSSIIEMPREDAVEAWVTLLHEEGLCGCCKAHNAETI